MLVFMAMVLLPHAPIEHETDTEYDAVAEDCDDDDDDDDDGDEV